MSNLPNGVTAHDIPGFDVKHYDEETAEFDGMTEEQIEDYLEEKRYQEHKRIWKNIEEDYPSK